MTLLDHDSSFDAQNPERISAREFPQSPLITPEVEAQNWKDLKSLATTDARLAHAGRQRHGARTYSVLDDMEPTYQHSVMSPAATRDGSYVGKPRIMREATDEEAADHFLRWADTAEPIAGVEQRLASGDFSDVAGMSLSQRATHSFALGFATDVLLHGSVTAAQKANAEHGWTEVGVQEIVHEIVEDFEDQGSTVYDGEPCHDSKGSPHSVTSARAPERVPFYRTAASSLNEAGTPPAAIHAVSKVSQSSLEARPTAPVIIPSMPPRKGSQIALIEPELAEKFPDSKAVNDALKELILLRRAHGSLRGNVMTALAKDEKDFKGLALPPLEKLVTKDGVTAQEYTHD